MAGTSKHRQSEYHPKPTPFGRICQQELGGLGGLSAWSGEMSPSAAVHGRKIKLGKAKAPAMQSPFP